MTAQKKPWSARITSETRDRLELLKVQSGMEPETLLAALLDSYEAQEIDTELTAPVMAGPRRELPVITKALQSALDSMASAIQLAETSAAQVGSEAQDRIAVAESQVTEFEAAIVFLKQRVSDIEAQLAESQARVAELENALATARDQAESVADLKAAWHERETELKARIVDLDAEAQAGRKVKAEHDKVLARAERVEEKIAALTKELASLRELADKERAVRIQAEQVAAVATSKAEGLDKARTALEQTQKYLAAAEKQVAVSIAQREAEQAAKQRAEEAIEAERQRHEQEYSRLLSDRAEAISERKEVAAKLEAAIARITELEKELAHK